MLRKAFRIWRTYDDFGKRAYVKLYQVRANRCTKVRKFWKSRRDPRPKSPKGRDRSAEMRSTRSECEGSSM